MRPDKHGGRARVNEWCGDEWELYYSRSILKTLRIRPNVLAHPNATFGMSIVALKSASGANSRVHTQLSPCDNSCQLYSISWLSSHYSLCSAPEQATPQNAVSLDNCQYAVIVQYCRGPV
jgi:hypothetical protein